MNNAVTYHRVSTVEQNPELARAELRQAARARGFAIFEEIEETGSGGRNDRPGLERVMELARKGRIKAVVVWKLDRFGRSALDLLANIRELSKRGVRFIATTQGLDITADGDAISKLMLVVLAAVAEFEREIIRERTHLGLAEARAKGIKLGRPSKIPPEAIKRALAIRRRGGHSWSKIASCLAKEGYGQFPRASIAGATMRLSQKGGKSGVSEKA